MQKATTKAKRLLLRAIDDAAGEFHTEVEGEEHLETKDSVLSCPVSHRLFHPNSLRLELQFTIIPCSILMLLE